MIQIRPTKPREIPEVLQQLALKSARFFVGEKAGIVMNFMIKQDCVGEVELGQRLHFDPPLLRGQLSDLLQEQFLEKRSKLMENSDGKPSEVIYYFVNYKSLADLIQFKLFKIRQILVQESKMKHKSGVKHPDAFQCTNRKCGRKFNELDARALFHVDKNNFFCLHCHELLAEIKVDALGSDDKLMQFQQFTDPLLKLVEEASKFYIDLEPEPEVVKEVQVSIEPSKCTEQPTCSSQIPKDSQVKLAEVAPKSSRPKRIALRGPSKETNISETEPTEPEAIDVEVMDLEESHDTDLQDEFMSDSDSFSD